MKNLLKLNNRTHFLINKLQNLNAKKKKSVKYIICYRKRKKKELVKAWDTWQYLISFHSELRWIRELSKISPSWPNKAPSPSTSPTCSFSFARSSPRFASFLSVKSTFSLPKTFCIAIFLGFPVLFYIPPFTKHIPETHELYTYNKNCFLSASVSCDINGYINPMVPFKFDSELTLNSLF